MYTPLPTTQPDFIILEKIFLTEKANHHINDLISIIVVFKAALANTEAGIVNVLSASSCFFTLLLSAVFPSNSTDSPTLTKVSVYY